MFDPSYLSTTHQLLQPLSAYRGVSWHSAGKKWHARICVNGKSIHLGHLADEAEAARAYDAAARLYRGKAAVVNFPRDEAEQRAQRQAHPAGGTSAYRGVYWGRSSKKWAAQIRIKGTAYYLGGFDDEADAARAYDAVARTIPIR